jgi:hypothetical protein
MGRGGPELKGAEFATGWVACVEKFGVGMRAALVSPRFTLYYSHYLGRMHRNGLTRLHMVGALC